jgi:MFS family permease
MIGSIVKSGGMPPIIEADLKKGQGEWRVYVGFLIVGLSQPLYQCTPALLSASWFPDVERTLATGIALNANQIGIGFAFMFGTLLVVDSDDIPPYFGLLSMISTVTFLGVLIQFEDAPPTPPSDSARVMRGTLEVKLPSVQSMFDSIRNIGVDRPERFSKSFKFRSRAKKTKDAKHTLPKEGLQGLLAAPDSVEGARRRNGNASEMLDSEKVSASCEAAKTSSTYHDSTVYPAPSPSNVGAVTSPNEGRESDDDDTQHQSTNNPHTMHPYMMYASYFPYVLPPDPNIPIPANDPGNLLGQAGMWPSFAHHNLHGDEVSYFYPPYPGNPHQLPYPEQSFDHFTHYQTPQPLYGSSFPYQSYSYPPYSFSTGGNQYAPSNDALDEGAEPVLILTPHHLDINIRDDQVLLSIKACMARRGFVHSLVSFTVSGVVINTLSTFMDYLVRLNGAGRAYTGIVGGTFQFAIMVSSLIVGKICDTTRAYYSITIFMLVMGAFGLAECGVSLDEAKGTDLRFALVIVALLVGPLQPISTELGVEVAYPLSENTVLVIQQLFSNLLSAMFIPCFKAMKDMGLGLTETRVSERPEYTFSFYLLIVLHAGATVFFATFNGRYLRHDHELEKAAVAKRRAPYAGAFRLVDPETQSNTSYPSESMPLIVPDH